MGNRKIVPLKFGEDILYMEVAEVEAEENNKISNSGEYENVGAVQDKIVDTGEKITGTVRALASTVRQALEGARPKEWSLEISLGFKGSSGIPFIVEGEANGSVKVIAKWDQQS